MCDSRAEKLKYPSLGSACVHPTLIQRLAPKPAVYLLCPRQAELAEPDLRISGSSSAWCSAHKGSAAAGRMFEDPELLRSGSARDPWSLEQQSSRSV
ncbi:MAG: hypothetical protein IPL83_05455 [Bdellovibrionales bacterium]|nr:hypothetical protein [Bdellovibrionales bacterium]